LVELLRRRDLAGKGPLGGKGNPVHHAISFIEICDAGPAARQAASAAVAAAHSAAQTAAPSPAGPCSGVSVSHRRRLAVLELTVGLGPGSFFRRTEAWDRVSDMETALRVARNLDQPDDYFLPDIKPRERERVELIRQAFNGAKEPPTKAPAAAPSDEQLAALVQLLLRSNLAAVRKALADVGALARP
jgi:hypothetical protein